MSGYIGLWASVLLVLVVPISYASLRGSSAPEVSQTNTYTHDKIIKKQYAQMYQMWALSKNYQFGLTVPKNKNLAYAWLHLYVSSLPADYPGAYHWLHRLRQDMNADDIKTSQHLFSCLTTSLSFEFSFKRS